jgi:hypothetical protein
MEGQPPGGPLVEGPLVGRAKVETAERRLDRLVGEGPEGKGPLVGGRVMGWLSESDRVVDESDGWNGCGWVAEWTGSAGWMGRLMGTGGDGGRMERAAG